MGGHGRTWKGMEGRVDSVERTPRRVRKLRRRPCCGDAGLVDASFSTKQDRGCTPSPSSSSVSCRVTEFNRHPGVSSPMRRRARITCCSGTGFSGFQSIGMAASVMEGIRGAAGGGAIASLRVPDRVSERRGFGVSGSGLSSAAASASVRGGPKRRDCDARWTRLRLEPNDFAAWSPPGVMVGSGETLGAMAPITEPRRRTPPVLRPPWWS